MTNRFMPEDVTGRLISIDAAATTAFGGGGGTTTIRVLNRTGKVLTLTAFNAMASDGNAHNTDTLADIQNATGTMLATTVPLGPAGVWSTARAGVLHATNLAVANAGVITFLFTNIAGGTTLKNAQATAYFTVVA